eukprot:403361466
MFGQHQQQQQLAYQTNYDPTFPIPPIPSSSNFNNFHGSNSFNNSIITLIILQLLLLTITTTIKTQQILSILTQDVVARKLCGQVTLKIGWMSNMLQSFLGNCLSNKYKAHQEQRQQKNSSAPQFGYGFVEFTSHEIAKKYFHYTQWSFHSKSSKQKLQTQLGFTLSTYNKTGYQNYQNNGHAQNYSNHQGSRKQEEYQIYVGDLDPNVNDQMLMITFQKRYPSVNQAKVIMDPITRQSKCYGFVKFGIIEEGQNAMAEMQGKLLLTKAMKINHASQKKQDGGGFHQGAPQMQKNFQYQNPQQLPYQQPFGQQNPFLQTKFHKGALISLINTYHLHAINHSSFYQIYSCQETRYILLTRFSNHNSQTNNSLEL